MNDEEKAYEAFRVTNWLADIIDDVWREVSEKFRRGTRYPYFQRYTMTDDKNNRWVVLFYQLSKAMRRQEKFFCKAYTTYDIPRRRVMDDVNAGRGCLLFDPKLTQMQLRGEKDRHAIIYDIVPHAFNRYTERYLKPLGKQDMEFARKIEDILSRSLWFDILADMEGDRNAAKHRGDNICSYDIIMRGGGMLRGQIVHEMLLRISTYVSEDMFFDIQHQRQQKMVSEYYRFKRRK